MTLSDSEIDALETALGHQLPQLFRRLLAAVGYGPVGPDSEIYHPLSISEIYAQFFHDPDDLFNVYFPIGCNQRSQELWIVDMQAEAAAAIWHETVPDDWPEEEWLPYDAWLARYLKPSLGTR